MTQFNNPNSLMQVHAIVNKYHVRRAQDWGAMAGTDYWALFSDTGQLTAGNAQELSDYGWTTTSLNLDSGDGGDFLSSSDAEHPERVTFGAASDLLLSPNVFGDYSHSLVAANLLGYTPTRLNLELRALFTVVTNNETASGFGLIEAGGSPITAADHIAYIFSNGTNFGLRSGADSDLGAAADTAWHTYKVVITNTTSATDAIQWYIDGTSQGTIDLTTDEFPCHFGAGVLATTGANFFAISWIHIWYD